MSEIDANHVIVPSIVAKVPSGTEALAAQAANLSWVKIPPDKTDKAAKADKAALNRIESKVDQLLTNADKAAKVGKAASADDATNADKAEYQLAYQMKLRAWSDYTPKFKEAAETKEPEDQKNPEGKLEVSYQNTIADYLWPVPYDSIHVELRRGRVTDNQVKNECFDLPTEAEMEGLPTEVEGLSTETEGLSKRAKFDFLLKAVTKQLASKGNTPALLKQKEQLQRDDELIQNNVVCGFIKTGNLGQIMQTLGKMALVCTDKEKEKCPPKASSESAPKYPPGRLIRRLTRTLPSPFIQRNGFGCRRITRIISCPRIAREQA